MDERTIGAHDTMSVSSCINSFNTWGFISTMMIQEDINWCAPVSMKNLDNQKRQITIHKRSKMILSRELIFFLTPKRSYG